MAGTLIVYATREGQTEKIAGTIARELESSGAEAFLVNAADIRSFESLDINAFDKIVLGASLHAGHIEKELVRFIGAYKAVLEQKPCWFFLVLMAAATPDMAQREKDLQTAEAMVRKQVPMELGRIEMIAGALMYTRYNWFIKWMMKRISAKQGGATDTSRDHEYTDWVQVRDYAARIQQGDCAYRH